MAHFFCGKSGNYLRFWRKFSWRSKYCSQAFSLAFGGGLLGGWACVFGGETAAEGLLLGASCPAESIDFNKFQSPNCSIIKKSPFFQKFHRNNAKKIGVFDCFN